MKNVNMLLMLLGLSIPSLAQSRSTRIVSGVVTLEGGQTKLPGVVVAIKGTSFGTYSDANGHYSVKLLPNEEQLVFSIMGYQPQEVRVDAQRVINVGLKPDPQTLPELKVTRSSVPQHQRRLKQVGQKR